MDNDGLLNFKELDDEIQNILDHSEYHNHLKVQLEEIEVLRAMYYQDKEFIVDEGILTLVSSYVEEKVTELPPTIDFIINLSVDDISLEIQVVLPKLYPSVEPKMFVRNGQFSGNQIISLNSDLKSFVSSIDRGNICVLEGIIWVSDNVHRYKEAKIHSLRSKTDSEKLFSRFWIYSHHIYSKEKRRHMLSLSKQYNLTGFCLGGRPGIICVEGWDNDCNEWWQQVRNMTWKKIMCIKREEDKIPIAEYETRRKFQGFCEISFQSEKSNRTDTHTDMGEFFKYLADHNCGHIFKDYFGFEGKRDNIKKAEPETAGNDKDQTEKIKEHLHGMIASQNAYIEQIRNEKNNPGSNSRRNIDLNQDCTKD